MIKSRFIKFWIVILLSLNTCGVIQAQNEILDSLLVELERAIDTNEVNLLNEITMELTRNNPEEALKYAHRALNKANELEYEKGKAVAYQRISVVHYYQSNYQEARDYCMNALVIFQELGNDKGIASCNGNIGNLYADQGNYPKAMEYYLNALKSFEKLGNKSAMALANNLIANVYYYQKDLSRAEVYYQRSLALNEEINNEYGLIGDYNNLGLINSETGNYEVALDFYLKSINLNDGRDLVSMANTTANIGGTYFSLKSYLKALEYYIKALVIFQKNQSPYDISKTYYNIGKCHYKLRDNSKSLDYYQDALAIAMDVNNKRTIADVYLGMAELYAASNNFKAAYENYNLYFTYNDSLINEERTRQITEMEKRFENEQREAEIDQLKNEKTIQKLKLDRSENLRIIFILIAVLTFILAFFVYYRYRAKRKANIILEEKNKLEEESKLKVLDVLGQQVSKDIAQELIKDSTDLGSNRKYVCIMFLDIRDFTPFAEQKEPEEIIDYQNAVFGFMVEIINKHHGIVNQFVGDGFMATFGAPLSYENDSQNAVNASLEIIQKLDHLNENGVIAHTRIGIGMHTGNVVAGNVGTAQRKQYSITGNTVILASRIEQLNKKFNSQILISEEVLQHVDRGRIDHISLGEVQVKGRAKPIHIIKLLS